MERLRQRRALDRPRYAVVLSLTGLVSLLGLAGNGTGMTGGTGEASAAAAVPTAGTLRLSVRPGTTQVGVRTRFRIRVTTGVAGAARAVRWARVSFAGRVARTNSRGRVTFVRSLRRAGSYRVRTSRPGFRSKTARVRVRPAACSGRRVERNAGCRTGGSSSGVARGDFNGDGFGDLAIGTPSEDVVVAPFIAPNVGQVSILYGTSTGLLDTGNQIFNQNSPGIADAAEPNDRFGDALAAGDFDGDGRSDLAIGVPGEDIGAITDAGAVSVLYGTAAGLSSARNQFLHQDTLGILDPAETGDSFGESLAWGNFGRGLQGDLVIGIPLEESVSSASNAGFIAVLYGSSTGLITTGNQFFSQGGTGDAAGETGDTYGATVAAANFGRSAEADIAVGAPLEDRGSFVDVGAVRIVYGSPNGLVTPGDQFLFQPGTVTEFDQNDRFGSALAGGDFDANGSADLAVGVPREDVGDDDNAGQVNILFGSSTGISSGSQVLTQDTTSVPGDTEGDDRFGEALAATNLGNGAAADLAVGSPGEDSRTSLSAIEASNVGSVTVLYGTGAGISGAGSQSFNEDSDGVPGGIHGNDGFGSALTAWNFGASPEGDLAVGVPGEDVGDADDAGSVNVLYGSSSGLRGPGSQRWTQDSPGVLDASEAGDRFGAALY